MTRTRGSRIRRAAMWAGVVACITIGALWIATGRWGFGYAETRVGRNFRQVMLVTGAVRVSIGSTPIEAWGTPPVVSTPESPWRLEGPYAWQWRWYPKWFLNAGDFDLIVPLWFPLGVLALLTFWLWSIERHDSRGRCHCGYDLSGIPPGAPCPECGAVRSSPSPAPPRD